MANLYSKAKENNMLSGIIIFDIVAFLAYVINPFSFLYIGDIALIFGGIVALLFALKNRNDLQTAFKTALYVGLIGAILSAVSISVFQWVFSIIYEGFNFITLWMLLLNFFTVAIVVGIVLSLLIGYIYYRKDLNSRKVNANSKYTDEYLEDLLKK
jgi:uncharacterized membrane protein